MLFFYIFKFYFKYTFSTPPLFSVSMYECIYVRMYFLQYLIGRFCYMLLKDIFSLSHFFFFLILLLILLLFSISTSLWFSFCNLFQVPIHSIDKNGVDCRLVQYMVWHFLFILIMTLHYFFLPPFWLLFPDEEEEEPPDASSWAFFRAIFSANFAASLSLRCWGFPSLLSFYTHTTKERKKETKKKRKRRVLVGYR